MYGGTQYVGDIIIRDVQKEKNIFKLALDSEIHLWPLSNEIHEPLAKSFAEMVLVGFRLQILLSLQRAQPRFSVHLRIHPELVVRHTT